MNNSKITLENLNLSIEKPVDRTPFLREKESEIVKIIEVIGRIAQSDDWNEFRKLVLYGVSESLERQLNAEARKKPISEPELYSLNGQLTWAKKFTNFDSLAEAYRKELSNIRQQLDNE